MLKNFAIALISAIVAADDAAVVATADTKTIFESAKTAASASSSQAIAGEDADEWSQKAHSSDVDGRKGKSYDFIEAVEFQDEQYVKKLVSKSTEKAEEGTLADDKSADAQAASASGKQKYQDPSKVKAEYAAGDTSHAAHSYASHAADFGALAKQRKARNIFDQKKVTQQVSHGGHGHSKVAQQALRRGRGFGHAQVAQQQYGGQGRRAGYGGRGSSQVAQQANGNRAGYGAQKNSYGSNARGYGRNNYGVRRSSGGYGGNRYGARQSQGGQRRGYGNQSYGRRSNGGYGAGRRGGYGTRQSNGGYGRR